MPADLVELNNEITYSLETETITPDFFVQHYDEFLPRFIANGNPSKDTLYKK